MLTIKVFVFNPVAENTYIIFNEQKYAIIIDPGCYSEEEKNQLENFLFANELNPVQLLNTHCHLDHVFGNKWVHETYGLELYLHANEEMVLARGPQSGKDWAMPFENYAGALHFLKQGDVVMLGSDELKVLETPGHSPGSISFYCAAQNFVIAGDALFKESIGRTDLPGSDYHSLIESINNQLMVLPDDAIVYSGHGEKTTIGHERKYNPFLRG